MGFYSQVLRILRDCYGEVNPALGFGPFSQALEPGDELELPDLINGTWDFWSITFPTNALQPGDADPSQRDFLGALARAAGVLAGWVQSYEAQVAPAMTFGGALQAGVPAPGQSPAAMLQSLLSLEATLQGLLTNPPNLATVSTTIRHLWMAIYFATTNLLGIIKYGLFTPAAFRSDGAQRHGLQGLAARRRRRPAVRRADVGLAGRQRRLRSGLQPAPWASRQAWPSTTRCSCC